MNETPKATGETVASNLIWRFAERWGAQGVSFIVSLVLARLLMPSDYGLIALVSVTISILNVFIDSGMASALIQKKDADDLDFSSVFYFNIFFCVVLYILLFLASPMIARLYHTPELTPVLRVVGITLLISGVKNTQLSYVSKTMQFKRFFFATLGGTLAAAVVGIVMAYHGLGVWALVTQQVANSFIDTVILWITVKWRPKKVFSFQRLKGLLSFGWKMLASGLLDTVYNNVRQLIIGVMYTSEDLAFYNKGKAFPWLVIENINSSINSVLLPAMSSVQDDTDTLRAMTRRSIKVSVYVMAPIMIGLYATATPLIRLILTEKWLPCIPYMHIFCITYIFYPIHTANLNAVLAKGRSDIFLKLEIVKKVMGAVVLISTMWFGTLVMAYSLLFTTVMSMIINSWPNRKLLSYTLLDQLADILPALALSGGMGLVVHCVTFLRLNDFSTLLVQVPLGAALYIAGSKLFHLESFEYVLSIAKGYLHKNK